MLRKGSSPPPSVRYGGGGRFWLSVGGSWPPLGETWSAGPRWTAQSTVIWDTCTRLSPQPPPQAVSSGPSWAARRRAGSPGTGAAGSPALSVCCLPTRATPSAPGSSPQTKTSHCLMRNKRRTTPNPVLPGDCLRYRVILRFSDSSDLVPCDSLNSDSIAVVTLGPIDGNHLPRDARIWLVNGLKGYMITGSSSCQLL